MSSPTQTTRRIGQALLASLFLAAALGTPLTRGAEPVVRAVLFYSPSCPHCHVVMTEVLPPLQAEHGDRLQIVTVNVDEPEGDALYDAAVEHFEIQPMRRGVPALIIGETVLVGSREIPTHLPSLIEDFLAQGGVDWPDIPGLAAVLPSPEPDPTNPASDLHCDHCGPWSDSLAVGGDRTAATPAPEAVLPPSGPPDPLENLARDPVGNGLAVAVLAAMLVALAWAVGIAWRTGRGILARAPSLAIPVLSVAGLAVAAYLAHVETADIPAVCGPVGDCNTVQQSPYARLFGVLPIGVLGLAGYVAIISTWAVGRFGPARWAEPARLGLVAMTVAGTAFSIYLTFLEPFVIGATCAWCLTSSVIMTLLMLIAVRSMRGPVPAPGSGAATDTASAPA